MWLQFSCHWVSWQVWCCSCRCFCLKHQRYCDSGVFGMNFNNGGPLVYSFDANNGYLSFVVVTVVILVLFCIWFKQEGHLIYSIHELQCLDQSQLCDVWLGFFEMLTTKEINKHGLDLRNQQLKKEIDQSNTGSYSAFSHFPLMSSSQGSIIEIPYEMTVYIVCWQDRLKQLYQVFIIIHRVMSLMRLSRIAYDRVWLNDVQGNAVNNKRTWSISSH